MKRVTSRQLDQLAVDAARIAAPAFSAAGWTWGRDDDKSTPDAAAIAVTIRSLMSEHEEWDGSRTTGRLTVARFTEDDEEQYRVSLELGVGWGHLAE